MIHLGKRRRVTLLAGAVSCLLLLPSFTVMAGEPPTRASPFYTTVSVGPVTFQAIKDSILRWEGYRVRPYRDRGAICVGVGHNLSAARERVKPLYTAIEIEQYFCADVAWSLDAARSGIDRFDELPQDVQLVVFNIVFSVGRAGFERFRELRLALGYRAYGGAATALGTSLWYRQVASDRANWAYRILLYHATRL